MESDSPMSLEDPDEPSPSPINPITLKHTLRLASRASVPNSTKVEGMYFEEYPNLSLLFDLGKTLNAISVNDISFSPTPIHSSKSSYKGNKKKGKKNLGRKTEISKCSEVQASNKFQGIGKNKRKDQIISKKKLIDMDKEISREKLTSVFESVGYSENPNKNQDGNEMAFNQTDISEMIPKNQDKIAATPVSSKSNCSFEYSKWIKTQSIKNFITRYIPRFLLPAFKAIENLRIRFAIPRNIERKGSRSRLEQVKKNAKFKRKCSG
ncbi:SNF2 family N-terminal domain protein [Cryptosporidium felis]|nr:SNF2 family N-terminal domain protein [Cryptosporidium felis]